jgi:hypothetical protein
MVKAKGKLLFYVGVLVVVISLFLAGSSFAAPKRMYTGPERPASETALIRGASSEINIESCDGVKVTSLDLAVLPGDHIVEMSFSGVLMRSADTSFLQLIAEAGHTYIVDIEDVHTQPGARYHAFILDKTTGKRVSRHFLPPSQLEQRLAFNEQSLNQFPQNADSWAEKGYLLIKLKRYEEALPALEKATELKPDSAEAWFMKSGVLYELKRYDEAITAVDKAIQLRPNEPAFRQGKQTIMKRANSGT